MLFDPFLDIDYTFSSMSVVNLAYFYREYLISLPHLFIKYFYVLPEDRVFFVQEFNPIVDPGSLHYHRTINRILKYDKIGFDEEKVFLVILLVGTIPAIFLYFIIKNLFFSLAIISLVFFKKVYPPRGAIIYKPQQKLKIDPFIFNLEDKYKIKEDYNQFFIKQLYTQHKDEQTLHFFQPPTCKIELAPFSAEPKEFIKNYHLYQNNNFFKGRFVIKNENSPFLLKKPDAVFFKGKDTAADFLKNYAYSEEIPMYTPEEYMQIVADIDNYNLFIDTITLMVYFGAHFLYFFL